MENEVKKPRISEEIDGKIDLIKKNIEFCQTNGIPEALETGGKYFKSFSELISGTVAIELEQLGSVLKKMFPFLPNTREGEKLAQIIQITIDNSHDRFAEITRIADEDSLKAEFTKAVREYADKYVEFMLNEKAV
ncbi:MAG: hypothetical protein K2G55_15385 [Lachnospiraceae bacterium]|nr:hypothetical protein [Lachnospiraceae bacterium]MDE7201116.1 hypothetical protein [Lachnospiraceae bacterium]